MLTNIFSFLGLWTIFYYLGNCLGPVLGGIFVQQLGFVNTAGVFVVVYLIMMALDLAEACWMMRRGCQLEKD